MLDGERVIDFSSGALAGSLQAGEASQTYTFEARAGVSYSFRITGGAGEAVVAVFKPDGRPEFSCGKKKGGANGEWRPVCSGRRQFGSWTATADGVYTVVVEDREPDAARQAAIEYRLELGVLSQPLAANPENAAELKEAARGSLATAGDADTYWFEATAGSLYSLSAVSPNGANASVSILSEDGTSQTEAKWADLKWVAEASGKYYVVVGGLPENQYTLTMQEDLDDQLGEPSRLELGGESRGRIDFEGDRDGFVINAKAGVIYVITIEGEAWMNGGVWNPELDYFQGHEPVKQDRFAITFRPRRDGEYVVQTSTEYGGGEQDYVIRMEVALDDQTEAMPLLDMRGTGRTDYAYDDDYFTFEVKAGTVYSVAARGLDGRHGAWKQVFDDQGRQVAENEYGDALFYAPRDGTFTIEASTYAGSSYEVVVTENPTNLRGIQKIELAQVIHGLADWDEEEWEDDYPTYWFLGEAGKRYRITLESEAEEMPDVELLGPYGHFYSGIAMGGSIRFEAKETQVYLVSVWPYQELLEFRLKVEEITSDAEEPPVKEDEEPQDADWTEWYEELDWEDDEEEWDEQEEWDLDEEEAEWWDDELDSVIE